ncbi:MULTISPECIES: phage protein [unclassified Vibrio]|uniref:phage protein n=1 Tax=unclassified Vibrio TaxID=2614977 RepID=UPI001361DC73|nr:MULTISPECIES: phage protein [unclassified Vibrio]NAW57754.1 S-adenosylhomocysteine hydrolase [Vibrio sp. V36_P2S2PM302]NAX28429.1 S-adenosylhomocysteine hydrolase [Vibrio sp. V38_P2S17PM301]NAX29567.1 S-adenosylhomocysteine hydrolase [Vibrio sp. V37_P2S8PM304]
MTFDSFHCLFWREFDSIKAGADFFHVKPVTVRRWLRGEIPINPMAEKLLIIKAIGYLPNDARWRGFSIDEQRAVLVTPTGREFSPKELESFAHWRDEYHQLVELHGHIESPKYYPAKDNVLPFRGGRRMQAAPWIPTKLK